MLAVVDTRIAEKVPGSASSLHSGANALPGAARTRFLDGAAGVPRRTRGSAPIGVNLSHPQDRLCGERPALTGSHPDRDLGI